MTLALRLENAQLSMGNQTKNTSMRRGNRLRIGVRCGIFETASVRPSFWIAIDTPTHTCMRVANLRHSHEGIIRKVRQTPSVEELSDPTKTLRIFFPVIDTFLPSRDRWTFSPVKPNNAPSYEIQTFDFYGRESFSEIYKKVTSPEEYRSIFLLSGTLGYGKSHILAALAARLIADGQYVVYVPDCSGLRSSDYLRQLKYALMLGLSPNKNEFIKMLAVTSKVELLHLLERVAYNACLSGKTFYFIIDNVNFLDMKKDDEYLDIKRSFKFFITDMKPADGVKIVLGASGSCGFAKSLEKNMDVSTYLVKRGFTDVS